MDKSKIQESVMSSSQSNSDDDGFDDDQSQSNEDLFQSHCPGWISFILYLLIGGLLAIIPALFVTLVKRTDPKTIFYNDFPTDVDSQILRWSLFFSLSWIFLLLAYKAIETIPFIITSAIIFIFKRCSENIRSGLEFIVILKNWACLAAWMIFNVVIYRIIFSQLLISTSNPEQLDLIKQWQSAINTLITFMVLSIFIFIQKVFLFSIAVNFHQRAYDDRIKESKKSVKIIDKLRKAIKIFKFEKMFTHDNRRPSSPEPSLNERIWIFKRKDIKKQSNETLSDEIHNSNEKQEPVKINIEMQENITRRKTSSMKKNPSENPDQAADSKSTTSSKKRYDILNLLKNISVSKNYKRLVANVDVANNRQAKKLAKEIFFALCNSKDDEVLRVDFKPYFENEAESSAAFAIFDQDNNGSIHLKEMKASIISIYRERRAITRSLQDFSFTLKNLDNFFFILSALATFIFVLPIWGVPLSAILPFTSIILALSFIFGGTAKTTFECLIFLFVQHPYDAGDRVVIEDEMMVVDSVSLLTTTFTNSSNLQLTAPNAKLATLKIYNMRRSGDQGESVVINVDLFTPESKIRELRQRMHDYVQSQNRDFCGGCILILSELQNLNTIKLSFYFKTKGNWQDILLKISRKNEFMFALTKNVIDLEITSSGLLIQPLEYRDEKLKQTKDLFS